MSGGGPGGGAYLQEVGVIADFSEHINASQCVTVACEDGLYVLTGQVASVQLSLIPAQSAEQHLSNPAKLL